MRSVVVSLALAAVASSVSAQTSPRLYSVEQENVPQIDLWLDQTTYRFGDQIFPSFETDRGAYVTVVRVTTDGALSILYPRKPRDQQPYEKGQLINDRVPYSSYDNRFAVKESDGIGFVFAIASFRPFNYAYFNSGGIWSEGRLVNEAIGDPFEIVRRFVDRTLGDGSDFSLDYVSYRVLDYGVRSRYATRYTYRSYDDFYNRCFQAFGYLSSYYCYNQYPGYFGPLIVVSQPGSPKPNVPSTGRNLAGKRIMPVTGDPMVTGAPIGPQITTEGRVPTVNPSETAAIASQRARDRQRSTPDRSPSQYGAPVQGAVPGQWPEGPDRPSLERRPTIRPEPQVQPVAQPRVEQQPMERPRYEPPRVEQPRYEPPRQEAPAPRVEVRNEPAPAPAPAAAPAPAPRSTATPATKDCCTLSPA